MPVTRRRMPLRLAVVAVAAFALWPAGSADARPTQENAQAGAVSAVLSYDTTDFSQPAQLQITRAGVRYGFTLYPTCFQTVPPCAVQPANYSAFGSSKPSLFVLELDGDQEPEVLVDLDSGGILCCRYATVERFDPSSASYVTTVHEWLSGGIPQLQELDADSIPEWIDADGRFRYAFDCGGCSPYPPQIWNFVGGQFVNVTRKYPAVAAQDAQTQLYAYEAELRKKKPHVRGILAAYVADEYLLGHGQRGWQLVHESLRRGALRGSIYAPQVTPQRYVKQLRRLLTRLGYIAA